MAESTASASLSHLLKVHQKKQTDIKRQNGQLCKDASKAASDLNETLTTNINERLVFRISEIFVRQKDIEQESRKLSNQTARYTRQTKQWIQTIDNFNGALKELGDVQNWAEVMENDMRGVMATLELVHHGSYF
ncbi:hypothetical protein INT43_008777 [Umbelopsis isabellina]|uniref:Biogenesis of lysosome-related organelles complex 1 subunit 1 n=1 Tax=Mortierella isabellina TaxID=91625 RepID=A0A8H7PWJ5_MORIS|nr:hypothetical protein INT43_008777 [Umbelopsis isabellina]